MRLYAHVGLSGELQRLVAVPEGEFNVMLTPGPGVRVYEVEGHGLKGGTAEIEQLEKLLKSHTVDVTSAKARLVRRKK